MHPPSKQLFSAALIYGALMIVAFIGAILWAILDPTVLLPAQETRQGGAALITTTGPGGSQPGDENRLTTAR